MIAAATSHPAQQKASPGPSTAVPQCGQRARLAGLGAVRADDVIGASDGQVREQGVHQNHE
jgi:hypothetical protein